MATYETETDSEPITAPLQPLLGEQGEPCAACGAPLASDQRYCLSCGSRRAGAPAPFMEILGRPAAPAPASPPAPAAAPPWYRSALGGVAAVAALALLGSGIALGLLIDRDPPPQRAAAPKPPVVNITNTGGAPAAAAPAAFTSDWPAGQTGWTVKLEALPKASTQPAGVAAAKSAATAQGANNVGALDSDAFPVLDPAEYVIYAGLFPSRKRAATAARRLRGKFPGAAPVQIGEDASAPVERGPAKQQSRSELRKKEQLSPEEYQREQRKRQPDKLKSEGAAPKEDAKEPGGGSGATEIG